ncbi:MAG: hypothetical protein V3U65_05830 [Granulosicoccaceae bacterium]
MNYSTTTSDLRSSTLLTAKIMLAAVALMLSSLAYPATQLWSTDGFMNPESALYDSVRHIVYVSNVNGGPTDKDNAGHISKIGMDGTMVEAEWVTGLNAPKGLVQHDNTLYVSDIDQLVAINVDTGEISGKWDAEGAVFLNDLAVDVSGRIYVSDMLTNRIYLLDGDTFSLWLEDKALQHPNGLQIDGNSLFIAPWGKDLQDDFSTTVLGHLIAVDLKTKAISTVGSGEPVGNLDGLESDGKGKWITTDWMAGALLRIDASGDAELLMDMNQGSADIGVINSEAMVLVPMMNDNKVIAISTR